MKTGGEIKAELAEIIQSIEDAAGDLIDHTEYYTCEEFAAKYRYKESTIRQMIKRRQITGVVKVSGRWMISENADILVKQYTKKNELVL